MRQVPMGKFTGGVLHSKFWVVDGRHVYVGSANMDWRSLTQVSPRPAWRAPSPSPQGCTMLTAWTQAERHGSTRKMLGPPYPGSRTGHKPFQEKRGFKHMWSPVVSAIVTWQ